MCSVPTGYLDVAYALLKQESHPSWLYAVNKGATIARPATAVMEVK